MLAEQIINTTMEMKQTCLNTGSFSGYAGDTHAN